MDRTNDESNLELGRLISSTSVMPLAPLVASATQASLMDLVAGSSVDIPLDFRIEISTNEALNCVAVTFKRAEVCAGFGVPPEYGAPEVTELVASGLQDALIEEFATTTPLCPGHNHPLQPKARKTPVWECPVNAAHWSCEIGQYTEKTGANDSHSPHNHN